MFPDPRGCFHSPVISLSLSLRSAIQRLEADVFHRVYDYLKMAREQNANETEVKKKLEMMGARPSDCFEVDQLLYFEEQLKAAESKHEYH
uniref:Uncharacterized protein n=1 Tax=Callorhinchus milii TaxID=7868 RepID=A0A4W3I1H3_CALMI